MNANINYTHTDDCRCISGRPIIVGALVAVGLSFILNLFSVAIGVTSYHTNNEGIQNLLIGGLLATAIGVIAVMFASGWLTGYLSQRQCGKRHLGALYGFLTWCVALILISLLASSLQNYVAFYTNFISGNMGTPMATDAMRSVAKSPENALVLSTYILFVLFFLSAFACSLGGHAGARYHSHD